MLPSRVWVQPPVNPEQEDIFSSSLGALFTDDTQNSHGTPGQSVVYHSPRYGDVTLEIPRHPDGEEGRKLFAHYLWNAGVVAADAIESASNDEQQELDAKKVQWKKEYWDVRGKDVLELGAGTALPSLISGLSSARSVTITDHPSSPALVADTIARNVYDNLRINLLPSDTPSSPRTKTAISIHGLTWGDPLFTSPTRYGKPSSPQPAKHSFDKIIVADCLWMPSQHANIVKTIDTYLRSKQNEAQIQAQERGSDSNNNNNIEEANEPNKQTSVPTALVIAGFHTGRSTVARFFRIATGSSSSPPSSTNPQIDVDDDTPATNAQPQPTASASDPATDPDPDPDFDSDPDSDPQAPNPHPTLRAAQLFEIDVDCNVRPWLPSRAGEDKHAAKRWCVVGVLVRR